MVEALINGYYKVVLDMPLLHAQKPGRTTTANEQVSALCVAVARSPLWEFLRTNHIQ